MGEAVAGHRLGRRALLWGGVAGTLPDLDVLLAPFQTPAEALAFHRGPTHSLLFAFVAAPMLGWLFSYLYRKRADLSETKPWMAVFFWALWTHPMLDFFTVYGTQLLWPLSRHPFALGSTFIIDPIYSLPLFGAVGWAFFQRDGSRRWRPVLFALAWSTLYLGWGVGARAYAEGAIARGMERQGVEPRRLLTSASPFNTVLWYGLAQTDSGFVATTYSLLDGRDSLRLVHVPRRAHLLTPLAGEREVETLRWFSQGYWSMDEQPDGLHLRDLRFGRLDGWQTAADSGYIFDFHLIQRPDGTWTFETRRPEIAPGPAFRGLFTRTGGGEP